MLLLKAIDIALLACFILGLVLLSIYLFEWIAFAVWMGILFVVMVIMVYKELE